MLASLAEDDESNFQWVREQLHFCVTLTLRTTRIIRSARAETQSFYELSHRAGIAQLEELLGRFLDAGARLPRRRRAPVHAKPGRSFVDTEGRLAEDGQLSVVNRHGLTKRLSRPHYMSGDERHTAGMWASWHKHYQSCWSIPLIAGGRTAGVMQFSFSKSYEWLPREQAIGGGGRSSA